MNGKLARTLGLAAGGVAAAWAAQRWWRNRRGYDFQDKVVLITGGSRGLGLLIAREMAQQGARLVICAREAAELVRVEQEFAAQNVPLQAIVCDVTRRDHLREMIRAVEGDWGPIDVLVNNAGVIQVGPQELMTEQDYQEALRIHFWAPLHAIEAVLPAMRRRGEGRIVNISSIGGKISMPHLLPYCASKFALVGLSQGLRAELARDGITVTTVCPGLMRTGSPPHARFKGQHRAEYAWFSISDALPGASMSAERAARQVVAACRRGDAEVILSLPAKMAVLLHGVFPGPVADLMGLVNRLLPSADGAGPETHLGQDSQSRWSPSWITQLSEAAAARNNELTALPREPI